MGEWPVAAVEDLVSNVSSGGTPKAGDPRYYADDGVPFLKIDDLTRAEGRFVSRSGEYITEAGLRESAAKVFPAGTVLITMYGTMGLTKTLTRPMATNQAIAALTPPFVCDGGYLAHALSYRRASLERMAAQTTQPNISGTIVRRFSLPVPPLEEQRRIAEILDTIDETVQATARVIAKLETAHEGLRRELVPERLDDGAEEVLLGDLIDPSRPIVYGILMPGDHVNGGVPVIKVKDIRGGAIADRRTLLHTSHQIDEQYARSRVREGDLLFTIRGTVGRMAFVPAPLDGANITQDTARLAIDGVNRSFLLAAMTADRFRQFVDVHTIGQAVQGINLRELRQAPVLLLPPDQQELVGATLDDSLGLIDAERRSLQKLRLLRSGIGADLLSGRVRTVGA
jgi:type I restriction enzyme S subunit